jgi:predicted nucleic acid-binding protein
MGTLGLTFDTGVLIALERRSQRAWNIYRVAMYAKVPVTVPTAVLGEWWRGRTDVREHVKSGLRLEELSEETAMRAGEAMAATPKATLIDAIVMASAATRGDIVYTSDVDDLERLRVFFPTVKVLSV